MLKNLLKSIIEQCFIFLPDVLYLKIKFRYHIGKWPNITNPTSYNEKIQWLKLYDRQPQYQNYVDKYTARKYIKDTIGEKYLIPLLGIYNSEKDIDWARLPNQFVLKCTHGSGCNVICDDKTRLNIEQSKKQLRKWMKRNWFWYGREWPYKGVSPRIICEKYMADESGIELKDYKIFCFNGEPRMIQVDYNRYNGHKRNLYDTNWNYIPASIKYPTDPNININRPSQLEEMLKLAKVLSRDYPHVRVDLYSISEKIYFGEMTFYHGSGFEEFKPEKLGKQMGDWIKIPL